MNIGLAIRRERLARGMLQAELAASAGLEPVPLCLIERGKSAPRWSTLVAIARALGMPVSALAASAEAIADSAEDGHSPHATARRTDRPYRTAAEARP